MSYNIKVIQRFRRNLAGEREFFTIDLDDEVNATIKHAILEKVVLDAEPRLLMLAKQVSANRSKDIFLCSSDFKDATKASFEAFAGLLSSLATTAQQQDSVVPKHVLPGEFRTDFLTAQLFNETNLDEKVIRSLVQIKRFADLSQKAITVKVEVLELV